ncbi:MAG: BON domain-containing protein [Bdellovibrio sp.]
MKILVTVLAVVLFVINCFAAEGYWQGQKGKTSDDQGMTQQDTDMTRTIREKLMDDSSLSSNAHNIKIISENSKVILKGNVASASERLKVESIAKGVAGKTPVINNTVISK